jgi:hypothetical protein
MMLHRNGPNAFSADRLPSLARCLARPVRCSWLSLAVADATLLLAVDRAPGVGDILDVWHDLQDVLREELANPRPVEQALPTATS